MKDDFGRKPLQGIEIWQNPKNKFLVFQLHYTADPAKRSEAFKENAQSGMPRAQFQQEYEIQWDSFSGMPVYQDYVAARHEIKGRIEPETGLVMLRGWDFGLSPACVLAQLQSERLIVFREFTAQNMGAERFSRIVLQQCALYFPAWGDQRKDWLDFIDPAGWGKSQSTEKTCAQVLTDAGMNPISGAIHFDERRSSVEQFLLREVREGPCLQIDAKHCPILVRGFKGGYRFPEKSADIEPTRPMPLKDVHSHAHDALQMITSRIMMMRKKTNVSVPSLSYGWMK